MVITQSGIKLQIINRKKLIFFTVEIKQYIPEYQCVKEESKGKTEYCKMNKYESPTYQNLCNAKKVLRGKLINENNYQKKEKD